MLTWLLLDIVTRESLGRTVRRLSMIRVWSEKIRSRDRSHRHLLNTRIVALTPLATIVLQRKVSRARNNSSKRGWPVIHSPPIQPTAHKITAMMAGPIDMSARQPDLITITRGPAALNADNMALLRIDAASSTHRKDTWRCAIKTERSTLNGTVRNRLIAAV